MFKEINIINKVINNHTKMQKSFVKKTENILSSKVYDSEEDDNLKASNINKKKEKVGPIAGFLALAMRKGSEKSNGSKASLTTNYTYNYNRNYMLDGLSDISSFNLDNEDDSNSSFRSSLNDFSTESILIYQEGEGDYEEKEFCFNVEKTIIDSE